MLGDLFTLGSLAQLFVATSWDSRGNTCLQDSGSNIGPSLVHCTRRFLQHEYNQQYNILELEGKRSTSRAILEKVASRDQMYRMVENTL